MVKGKKQWKIPQENVEKYREYRSRPVGVTEFERLPDGSYNVHVKECFCRVATRDADGNVVFCPEKKRFERKDNLIAHIKQAHRAEWDAMDASGKMNKAGNVSKERKEAAEEHFAGQVKLIKEATENSDELKGSTDNIDQLTPNDATSESGIKKRQRRVVKKGSRSASVVTNEDDESDGDGLFVKRTKTKSGEATISKEETQKGAGPSLSKELNNSLVGPISETLPRVQGISHAHPTLPQSTAPSPMASTMLNPSERLDHIAAGVQNIEWETLKAREIGLFTPQQLGQFQININKAELHVQELRKFLTKNTQYERLRPIFDSIQQLEKLILKDIGGNRFEPRKMSLLDDSLKDTLTKLASVSCLFRTA